MRIQQWAQHIGQSVFKVLRNRTRRHVAVQVAVTKPPFELVRQRVGDRHKRDRAAFNRHTARINVLQ